MSWAEPIWALALLGVVVLVVVVIVAGRVHRRRVAEWFAGGMLDRVLPRGVRARRAARDTLALAGLACLCVALAEPLYGKEVREIEKTGVDLVIAVDLSRSMDSEDVDPSRIERARREILDLISLIEADRVGLVVFAGGAWPRMPLTTDYDALAMLVGELNTSMFQAQGSEIGEALRLAGELLTGGAARPAGKAVLLLSDGESHDPADALAAAGDLAALDIRVYAMGIGNEAAPIPEHNGGFVTEGGKTVLSTPDPKLLRDLARITGGAYVQSVASASDMERLYRSEIRATLEAAAYGAVESETWRSGFQWPLGLGFLLLLLAAWLGDGRRAWGGIAAALLIANPAHAASLPDADALYRAGEYARAVEEFTELSLERPDDPSVFDRLGAARFRSGDFDGAARAWDTAAELRGEGTTDEWFNSGNAHWLAGRLEEARERYDHVLNTDRDHEGAAKNKTILDGELAARRALKPPESGDSGGTQGDQGEPGQEGDQGSPGQEGTQGEPGEDGQPGEGDTGGDGQTEGQGTPDGSDPSGQPPSGQDAEGQPGAQSESDSSQDAEGSRDEAPSDGQAMEDDPTGTPDIDEVQGGGDGGTEGEPFDGDWRNDGPVTPAQAEKLLEGVEEGRPRLVLPGNGEGRPW